MQAKPIAAWGQLLISQISSAKELHAHIDEYSDTPKVIRFYLHSTFVLPSICTIRFFVSAAHDSTDESGDITLRHLFCTANWWEVGFRVIKSLVAEIAARELVLLLDESIMASLCILDSFLTR